MNNSNIKVYLGISFALIILFIFILIIPFSNKKISPQKTTTPSSNQPFPTSIETDSTDSTNSTNTLTPIPADFTGVAEEELSKEIIDLAAQKKDLRQKVLLNLSTFTIDFDYGEDKFIVTLNEPKDQSQKEFESWRAANYPGLSTEQFLLR